MSICSKNTSHWARSPYHIYFGIDSPL